MQNSTYSIHELLTSKVAAILNWIAATTGIMSFTGAINITVALLSLAWVATQLWHHYMYVRPKAKRALERSINQK